MAKIDKPRSVNGLAVFCAKMALDKKADNILLLDLTKLDAAPADFFVICECKSDIQIKSLIEALLRKSKELDIPKPAVEGLNSGYWVVVDFFDVVMHIMMPEARNFYKLEKLWGDAQFKLLDDDAKLKAFNTKKINY